MSPDDRPVLRRPQTLGGIVYLAVLGGTLVGVGIVALGPWRTGVSWIGAALLVAALTRIALPEARAGMLRVRRKYVDAVLLTSMGVALLFLAVTIPNQPG